MALVNAVGMFARADAADVTLDEWEALWRTNVTSTFLLCQLFGKPMIERGRGKIVNFNAVAPCDFATPLIEPFLDQQEYRDWILEAIPAGRVGQPDEIAGAVLFLASRASDMVVGHNLLVDGGRTVI